MNEEIDENECRIVAMFLDFESAAGDNVQTAASRGSQQQEAAAVSASSGSKQTSRSTKCLREAHALDPDESELRDEQVG